MSVYDRFGFKQLLCFSEALKSLFCTELTLMLDLRHVAVCIVHHFYTNPKLWKKNLIFAPQNNKKHSP